MPSQPQSSSANEALVRDKKGKQQAASSDVSGADTMTVEEREDEREVISHARPGGFERVVSEQRLPAEGIGASDGELRHAFTDSPDQDSAIKRTPSGEYAGEREAEFETRETVDSAGRNKRRDEISC